MPSHLKVGDKVHLNDYGLNICFGHTVGLAPLKRVIHTITDVDPESMTEPEPTHVVEVADPDLNRLLLSDLCFDKVPPGPTCPGCGCDTSKHMQEHKPGCPNFPW